jgi:hypothetical protein
MIKMKRAGNNPKRRLAAENHLTVERRTDLAKMARYIASGHHSGTLPTMA